MTQLKTFNSDIMKHIIIQRLGMMAAVLLSFLPVSAYDFEVDGIYYTITSMSDLEVEVTYESIISNYYKSNASPYTGNITIPSTVNYNNRTYEVVGIGKTAFGCSQNSDEASPYGSPTSITSISLPQTIRYIDDFAFQNCKIENIQLPSSLTNIGIAAFAYTPLQSIVLPNLVTTIGKQAFYKASIKSVVLGKGVKTVGREAFVYSSSLLEAFCTSKDCPSGLMNSTFSNSHSFLEIYVPSSSVYGFGKEYLTLSTHEFDYTGQSHNIEWKNNLKAYKCAISDAECKTETNAGTYTKYLNVTYSDGVDFSVEIPYEYTINKAPMTLTVNNIAREYGDENPAFTCNITGLIDGETEQTLGASPVYECEATKLSGVGDYRILASLDAPNYEVTYKYGKLSIQKAPLTASVISSTKIYGDVNPDFSLSYSGLKNSESSPVWSSKPTFTTLANASSGVGEYAVSANDGVAVNYEITKYNSGTLTVEKRNLTAKAKDCERLYNEENPTFEISYTGLVNGDLEKDFTKKPVAECTATKNSDAGTYSITVSGGEADNYNFVYQDGTLKINPLTVGFKNIYNTVTYNDMTLSTNSSYFNYVPEVVGPFSDDDFWIELWFLDKDNKYSQHVATISGGEYAGKYVNTNLDRPMWAGKYIFNLTSKGTNPNVTASPSRAYLTVNRTSNNLEWNSDSPITVPVGEKVDLGITYQADLWCTFNTSYDDELITLSSENENGNNPHWYATGLKEGETTLSFGIECAKNDMGFYNFSDSRTLSKRIKVVANSGINGAYNDASTISIKDINGKIVVSGKKETSLVKVYNLQGALVTQTADNEISNLSPGLYVVKVENKTVKVLL